MKQAENVLYNYYDGLIEAICKIGEYHYFKGQLEELAILLEAVNQLMKLPVTKEQKARILIQKVRIRTRQSFLGDEVNFTREKVMLEEALQLAEIAESEILQADALILLGECFYREGITTGIFDQALDYYEQALAIRREINDKRGIADALFQLGTFYENKKDSNEQDKQKALEFYQEALQVAEEGEFKFELALIYRHIAYGFYRKQDFEQAINYAEKSASLREEIGFKITLPFQYLSIGDLYYAKKDVDNAKNYYQKAYSTAKSIGQEQMIYQRLVLLLERIDRDYREQDKESVLEYYKQALTVFQVGKDIKGIAEIDAKIKKLSQENPLYIIGTKPGEE